uniref:Cystatin domain-containing protein n=1 Tax=Gopherus evgoodei TaxID=1825980 RepID=A0A8C4WCR8_9SAUR
MASCWAVLLLLVTVAAAVPVKTPQPYEKAIARAIAFYNQGPTVKYAFRLLTATPPPEVGTISNTLQLNFTIMETTCPASDKTPVEQCAFKENGVRNSSGGGDSAMFSCLAHLCRDEQQALLSPWGYSGHLAGFYCLWLCTVML